MPESQAQLSEILPGFRALEKVSFRLYGQFQGQLCLDFFDKLLSSAST